MADIHSLPTAFAPAERAGADELRADIAAFADSSLLRTMLDAVPGPYVVLNHSRQMVFANRSLLAMTGASTQEEVIGKRFGEVVGCAHAQETAGGCGTTEFCRTCGAVNASLNGLAGRVDVQECRISLVDGNALDLRVSATPLDHAGERFAMFAVQDISHEKRRRALERIFFHDLLNTAGGMLGYADIMTNASTEELEPLIQEMHELADQLVGEIKAQQILAAAENGELQIAYAPVEAAALLHTVVMLYGSHPAAMQRTIKMGEVETVHFSSDPTLVRRVLGNLVKNALEASAPGETVTVGCRAEAGGVRFMVHNTAVMPDSVRLQVFQRSFSTKGSGRGLGTYSVKLLTERYLQGRVTFSSCSGQGTVFHVWLPRAVCPAVDA